MTASYRSINYCLRPSKGVERKMLCEAFQMLRAFTRLEDYRYIGFGSIYFADFWLFHRALGINDMVSMERVEAHQERFRFNRPFSCIDLCFGESNDLLPELSWDKPAIVWLDYDNVLNRSVLADIRHVCTSAKPGSLLILTVNVEPSRKDDVSNTELVRHRMDVLRENVGQERLPAAGLKPADVNAPGLACTCRTIIANEIREVLETRNGPLSLDDRLQYRQCFNFQYSDGARMLTTGGVILAPSQVPDYEACGIENLGYACRGETPYQIDVPNLTYKELRHLNSKLPGELALADCCGIPPEDVNKYRRLYRYFPTYTEADM